MRRRYSIGLAVAASVFSASAALADSIDGKWCRADGRRMEIEGARISTPGGASVTGEYSRHAFKYMVPAGEEHGGTLRFLRLRGEYIVHAFPADDLSAEPEVWNRCTPVS